MCDRRVCCQRTTVSESAISHVSTDYPSQTRTDKQSLAYCDLWELRDNYMAAGAAIVHGIDPHRVEVLICG
jgi:hypothetical protein